MIFGIFKALQKFYFQRRTTRQLSELDDRQLADIGISRSDIMRVCAPHAPHHL